MKELGWIKIFRGIMDWEWYDDANAFRVFIHCVLSANIQDKTWKNTLIKRGNFVTSVEKISRSLNISIQQTRTALSKLKSTDCITIKTTSKFSIITIVSYDEYQAINKQKNKQSTNKKNNINKQITNNQQTNNKQITTTKEEKNIRSKEVKKKETNKGRPENFENEFSKLKKIWLENFPDYQWQDNDHFNLQKIIRFIQNIWKKNNAGIPACPKMDLDWAANGFQMMINGADDFHKTKKLSLDYWARSMNELYQTAKTQKNEKGNFTAKLSEVLDAEYIADFD